jgi:predicted NBD/HSP70 family sugar kinase
VLLSFNPISRFAVGVQLGGQAVRVALTDLNGNRITSRMEPSSSFPTLAEAVRFIHQSVREVLAEARVDDSLLLGIGVGVPGPLDETPEGRVTLPRFPGDAHFPLREALTLRADLPVIIDNNSNVAALAEKWFGQGAGYRDILYILAETGIGCGLIVHGQLVRGRRGGSGEIGHTTIDVNGEPCVCGNRGCVETFVSIPRIESIVRRRLAQDYADERSLFGGRADAVTFDDVVRAAHLGSRLARQTLEDAGRYLGVAVANAVNLLNPELVIVGGKLGMSTPIVADAVQAAVHSRVFSAKGKRTPVVASTLADAVVLGAAALVIDEAFSFFTALP